MLLVLKKYLPLQCFNKQRLFYSFKKAKKMKKLVFMFVAWLQSLSHLAVTVTRLLRLLLRTQLLLIQLLLTQLLLILQMHSKHNYRTVKKR